MTPKDLGNCVEKTYPDPERTRTPDFAHLALGRGAHGYFVVDENLSGFLQGRHRKPIAATKSGLEVLRAACGDAGDVDAEGSLL